MASFTRPPSRIFNLLPGDETSCSWYEALCAYLIILDLSPHGSSALDLGVHHWVTDRTGSLHDRHLCQETVQPQIWALSERY